MNPWLPLSNPLPTSSRLAVTGRGRDRRARGGPHVSVPREAEGAQERLGAEGWGEIPRHGAVRLGFVLGGGGKAFWLYRARGLHRQHQSIQVGGDRGGGGVGGHGKVFVVMLGCLVLDGLGPFGAFGSCVHRQHRGPQISGG